MDEAENRQGQESSFDNCVGSMHLRLGCIDHEIAEACSISVVPEQLRKKKVEAYMPQVVSIGPRHNGTRTDLLYMEEIKWRCMKYLFHRSNVEGEKEEKILRNCLDGILKLDEIVRASYVDDVKFNRNDLAKIMVLDGCFLLELLISGTVLNDQIKCRLNHSSPGAEVIKREEVLSDLTMLENQIPLVVLCTLSIQLFPTIFTEEAASIKLIHEHALSILGYSSSDFSNIYSREFKGFHFLQLVHTCIDKEKDNIKQKATKDWKIQVGSGEGANTSPRKVKLQRCATRLQTAGVKIEPPKAQSDASNVEIGVTIKSAKSKTASETRFDLRITFSVSDKKGKLEIPQLHITETTEAKWRNLIAWELNRTTLEKQRGRKEAGISCQFISYAWFFQGLICSVHDIQLLRDKKVILVQEVKSDKGKKKIMSNEDLLNLFRNITEGLPDAEIDMDSWFTRVIENLNSYPTLDRSTATCRTIVDRVTETSKIMWHIFRCFLTWIWYKWRGAYRVLRRVYIPSGWKLIAVLAAAAGLALTIAQTVFSALGR